VMRRPALALSLVATLGLTAQAHADCGASLATGLDISGSVSRDELLMQVDGIGAALRSPAVVSAFQTQGCVRVAVYVWGESHFVTLLPWTEIATAADAENVAANLRNAADAYQVPTGQLTNIAGALQYAWQLFGQIPPTGRQISNIITNGEQNVGGPNSDPMPISLAMRQAGITINAVAFGPAAELETYLRQNVTSGFVLRAGGAQDFPAIVRSKFIMDISWVQP
jgi:hypothetical protein